MKKFKPRPDGYTIETRKGVRKLSHTWVWEEHFGKVPAGHHIHHKNGKRADNRIENLEAIKPLDHKRLHCGYQKTKSGKWLKPCCMCRKLLPLESAFYLHDRYNPHPQHEC